LKPCLMPFKNFSHGEEATMELACIMEHPPPVEQEAAIHESGPNSTIIDEHMGEASVPSESPSGSSADYPPVLRPALKHFASLAEHNSAGQYQYSQPIEETQCSSSHCDQVFVPSQAASDTDVSCHLSMLA